MDPKKEGPPLSWPQAVQNIALMAWSAGIAWAIAWTIVEVVRG